MGRSNIVASVRRNFVSGCYYHIYGRGHHKDAIFRDNGDRRYFLSKLDEFCERDGITVVAYCLLDNHFHLLLRQDAHLSISVMMRSLLAGFVRAYNKKHGTAGVLFQGRFQAKLVHDEDYLVHLSRYIHLNPHPFANYRTYPWSSYREYIGKPGMCEVGPVLDALGGSKDSYAIYVEKAVSPEEG
jgi:putative transposase